MKKLSLLIAIIISSSVAYSQDGSAATNASSTARSGGSPLTKNSKVEVPAEKARPINIPKIGVGIAIDGKIDEEIWKSAAVFKDFYQTNPGDNTPASKPTEVYMVYDEKHLYVAFKCFDEKDKIRASIAKRDSVFGEDNVRMWLDTYNDQRRAYVIAFNPHGIQQDGIFTEGQGSDFSVDIVMESKGLIEDWGWAVEAKIPFKSLRYTAGKGKFWGFNVARNIDRLNDEFNQWLPDDRNISGVLIKHGKIGGFDEIKYERTLEVVPSITVSQTGKRVRTIPRYQLNPSSIDPSRFVNEPIKGDIGVTLKYTLSPNVTLDAAINPDFAEIEADAPVVTANQRFPIFFQEKRPFFLEGQDTFSTPLSVFYSRNIVDPDLAIKLTGKTGKTSFGFLVASDKAPGNYDEDDRNDPSVRPRIEEFLDKNALFAVMRIKRDFGKENNFGFFSSYRTFPEQKNLVAGFDGRIKISPKMTSVFNVVGTTSRRCFFDAEFDPRVELIQAQSNRETCGGGPSFLGRPPVAGNQYQRYRTGNGLGYYANIDYSTEKHGWFAEVSGRSKLFRADAGFTRRANTNFAFVLNRFSTKSDPSKTIIRKSWAQFSGLDYDWSGRLQKWRAGTNVHLSLQKSLNLFFDTGAAYEKLYEEEFGLRRLPAQNGLGPRDGQFFGEGTRATWQQFFSGNINQNVNKKFNYGGFFSIQNNTYDFFFQTAGKQNPGPGTSVDFEVRAEYKPISPLRTSVSYRKSRLVRDDNSIRSFDSDLVSLRSTYQFTRFIFARTRLDYSSGGENFSGQALLGWNPSPGTAFYVGYNDTAQYNGFNPYTRQREDGFERNGRAFFIRASYLFRKSF